MGIATGVVMAGLGVYGAIQESKEKRDAARELENLKRQEFENVAEGMQVSTLGADLLKEEQAKVAASQLESLQGAGGRGIIGGYGRVEAGSQLANRQIASDLDLQQKEIDKLKAEDAIRIRNLKEERERADVAALSSQYNAAKQGVNMGAGQFIQGFGMASQEIKQLMDEKKGKKPDDSAGIPTINQKIPPSIFTKNPISSTSSSPGYTGYRGLQYDSDGNLI